MTTIIENLPNLAPSTASEQQRTILSSKRRTIIIWILAFLTFLGLYVLQILQNHISRNVEQNLSQFNLSSNHLFNITALHQSVKKIICSSLHYGKGEKE